MTDTYWPDTYWPPTDVVEIYLERGASLTKGNERGETPVDVVSGPWSKDLSDLYTFLDEIGDLDLDLDEIKKKRPEVAKMLRAHRE